MVWHHMSFQYLYSLVLAQSSDYFLQVCSILIVYDLSSVFRNEHYVVLAHPFRMCQTACLVCHKISFHCSNRLDILFYHVWRFFGITFVTHPHSGWLSVSHFVLNLPKGTNQKQTAFRMKRRLFYLVQPSPLISWAWWIVINAFLSTLLITLRISAY